MPIQLEGRCTCGAVRFTVGSHTPVPYQLCYCSICRKSAGGGGFAINIMGDTASLKVRGKARVVEYRAKMEGEGGKLHTSSARRNFCGKCGSALWVFDPTWPELVHPFASAIDTPLPEPTSRVHVMLKYKAPWVKPAIGRGDATFDEYPKDSIEDWHRKRRLWID